MRRPRAFREAISRTEKRLSIAASRPGVLMPADTPERLERIGTMMAKASGELGKIGELCLDLVKDAKAAGGGSPGE